MKVTVTMNYDRYIMRREFAPKQVGSSQISPGILLIKFDTGSGTFSEYRYANGQVVPPSVISALGLPPL